MQAPPGRQGLKFDFLSLSEDFGSPSEVDIFGCQIIQALMVPPCIVIGDELGVQADRVGSSFPAGFGF